MQRLVQALRMISEMPSGQLLSRGDQANLKINGKRLLEVPGLNV